MTELTHFRLKISGIVQGVGYRDWASREATARGLNGWVRNRSDGSVEVFISGADSAVQEMLRACTRGPEGCAVTNIDIHNEKEPAAAGFVRRATL